MSRLLGCLLISLVAMEQIALGGSIVWNRPELVVQTTARFQNSTFTVIPLDSGPAIVYATYRPLSGPHLLEIAEPSPDGWTSRTLVNIGSRSDPMQAASAIRAGVPYVLVKLRYPDEVRIVSQNDGAWEEEYRHWDAGDTAYGNRMELVCLGEHLIAAHVNYKSEKYVTIVEESTSNGAWIQNSAALQFPSEMANIHGAEIRGSATFLIQGGRNSSNDRSYLASKRNGSWESVQVPHSIDGTLAEWNDRPAIFARSDAYWGPLIFDYLDANGSWQREIVSPGSTGGEPDMIVLNGQPLVAYRSFNEGLFKIEIATRNSNGIWVNYSIPDTASTNIGLLDLFEWQGRPAIVYMNQDDRTLHAIFAAPEPSGGTLLACVFAHVASMRARRFPCATERA